MAFTRGHPKYGGRRQGSGNRLSGNVAKRLEELGCDPIEGLVRIADDPRSPVEVRVKCYSILAAFVYPKLRAVEYIVSGTTSNTGSHISGTDALRAELAKVAERRAPAEAVGSAVSTAKAAGKILPIRKSAA